MTDTTAPAPDEQAAEPTATAPEAAPAEGAGPAADAAALAQEAAELKDRLLRSLAEMENLRRRNEREVDNARAYGIASFARELLTVADNMRRALDAVGADLRDGADPGIKAFIDGVELTERELLKAMEKHGVTRLEPLGQKFDPNLHEVMYEMPDPSVPAGTVVRVEQPGYRIGERVLRPALVAVAKGGPKATKEAPANDNADAPAEPPPSD